MKIKLLLGPDNFNPSFEDWKIEGVFNPGAVRMPDKRIVLYARIAESAGSAQQNMRSCPIMSSEKEYKVNYQMIHEKDIVKKGKWGEIYLRDGICRLPTISHFKKITLKSDGFNIEEKEQTPIFTGMPGDGDYGVEDSRIILIGDKYYMTYVSVSNYEGVSTSLAVSRDLKNWKRQGIIFREQNKDAVIFPEKIGGKYIALHRPEGFFEFSRPSVWISYSPDLVYWGREKSIFRPRPYAWDEVRIGAGAPPIKTKKGWLVIYHGVKEIKVKKEEKVNYSAGSILLDLKNPEKVLARSPRDLPLFDSNKYFEKEGFLNNIVFPTGAIPTLKGDNLLIYYGATDRYTAVREISFSEIFKKMEYY